MRWNSPRERYLNDPEFYALVDMMFAYISACRFTPGEMREAAVLASIMYEEQNLTTRYMIPKEIDQKLRDLQEWIKKEDQG